MSLYNMLFGTNPMADVLLATLGLTREDTGRFRDCFLQDGPDGPEVHIYTRNGGGNREEYQGTIDELAARPGYLGDADDDFDCTYATIRFRLPDQFREALAGFARPADAPDSNARWAAMLEKIQTDPEAPEAKRAAEAFAPIFKAIAEKTAG